MTLWLLL